MTSPAIGGLHLPVLEWNSNALQATSSGEIVLATWVVRGLDDTWEVRGEDTVIPSAHGRTARDRKRDYLIIEVNGFVTGQGASPALQLADVRSRIQTLRGVFDPTQSPGDLVVRYEDGDNGTISCRPVNLIWFEYPDPVYRPFSGEFMAVGADWVKATP